MLKTAALLAIALVNSRFMSRTLYPILVISGGLAVFALTNALHGSGFLAAFAAGMTITALDVELCDCFLEYGETTAELALLFKTLATLRTDAPLFRRVEALRWKGLTDAGVQIPNLEDMAEEWASDDSTQPANKGRTFAEHREIGYLAALSSRGVPFDPALIADLGIEPISAADGTCVTYLDLQPRHLQQDGFVHAGVQATMADHTAGGAAGTGPPTGAPGTGL